MKHESVRNAFEWRGQPSVVGAALAAEQARRTRTSAKVERERASGNDRSTFKGISKKSDSRILGQAQVRGNALAKTESATGRLRTALEAGPLNCAQLSKLTGISTKMVSPLLQHDIKAGRVVRDKTVQPWNYRLVKASTFPTVETAKGLKHGRPPTLYTTPGLVTPTSNSLHIEGQAAGQASSDRRDALRRGGR